MQSHTGIQLPIEAKLIAIPHINQFSLFFHSVDFAFPKLPVKVLHGRSVLLSYKGSLYRKLSKISYDNLCITGRKEQRKNIFRPLQLCASHVFQRLMGVSTKTSTQYNMCTTVQTSRIQNPWKCIIYVQE